jgi:hypothetical protein
MSAEYEAALEICERMRLQEASLDNIVCAVEDLPTAREHLVGLMVAGSMLSMNLQRIEQELDLDTFIRIADAILQRTRSRRTDK